MSRRGARPVPNDATSPAGPARCAWATAEPSTTYHDREWGVPARDERALFELLTLEGAQAGLSWVTILRKREGYRRAFRDFDADAVARFGDADVARLLGDAGIVRHRGKIESVVHNARAVLRLRDGGADLPALLWELAGGAPRVNRWRSAAEVPAWTPASAAMSRALLARGFRFVGPTTCYSLMQAAGMVNDHLVTCFRHAPLAGA